MKIDKSLEICIGNLDKRKEIILQKVVDIYISKSEPEPIGSRTLSKNLNISAATIRNEMGDLEEMGFLLQPHTSAGRVPSSAAYRYYVNSLMSKYEVTKKEINEMQHQIGRKLEEMDEILKCFSIFLSKCVNMPTVVMVPNSKVDKIKTIKLVEVDSKTLIVVIAYHAGSSKSKQVSSECDIDKEFLNDFEEVLNKTLSNVLFNDIAFSDFTNIAEKLKSDRNLDSQNLKILNTILDFVHLNVFKTNDKEIFMEGITNILRFPEYNNIDKAKEMLELFDEKKVIGKLLNNLTQKSENEENKENGDFRDKFKNQNLEILIGDENEDSKLKDNSIILSKIDLGNDIVGFFGIIGPTRMNYPQIIPKIEILTSELNKILRQNFDSNNNSNNKNNTS